jgi:hypothetical protein
VVDVDSKLGTMLLRPDTSVMKDLSSAAGCTAVMAIGVFWISVARRSA